jgi:hypothetical protein
VLDLEREVFGLAQVITEELLMLPAGPNARGFRYLGGLGG